MSESIDSTDCTFWTILGGNHPSSLFLLSKCGSQSLVLRLDSYILYCDIVVKQLAIYMIIINLSPPQNLNCHTIFCLNPSTP